jgi:hypothetical protein
MTADERRRRAMERIETARTAIVAAAADMTARGVETSPLAKVVVDLQDALAELSELDREAVATQALKN